MGSPAATPSTQMSSNTDNVKGVLERRDPRYRTKRCKHDVRGDCPYGDSCNYIHYSPPIAISHFAFPAYYPYSHLELKSLAPLQARGDAHNLEASLEALSLDRSASGSAPPMQIGYPPAPPSTPSTASTDISSPLSQKFAPLSPVEASPRPKRSRHRSENTGCFYRTKPCKFWHTTGRCVKGDRCNFIHDYILPLRSESGEHRRVRDHTSRGQTRSHRSSSKKPHPHKTESNEDGSNFYPIQWRVIGGGVHLSGHREVCKAYRAGRCEEGVNCKFAHSPSEEDEPVVVSDSESYYAPVVWSPVSPISPVSPVPFLVFHAPSISPRPLSPPQHTNTHIVQPTNVHKLILDGETLEPYSHEKVEPDGERMAESSSAPQDNSLLSARTIARPVSTPPATTASFKEAFRLFQAEMP